MRKEGPVIIYHGGGEGDTKDFHYVTTRFA